MKFNFMRVIKPAAKVGMALAKGNPVVAAVTTGIDLIDQIKTASAKDRADLYFDFAVGLMGVSSEILQAVKDGRVTDEEQEQIKAELKKMLKEMAT